MGIICAFEIGELYNSENGDKLSEFFSILLGTVPWLGWLLLRLKPRHLTEVDRKWLVFRDSFGLVWGQRQREQFNRAAANAGWSVRLGWGGLRRISEAPPPANAAILALLAGVLKRFGTPVGAPDTNQDQPPGPPLPERPIPPPPGPPLPDPGPPGPSTMALL